MLRLAKELGHGRALKAVATSATNEVNKKMKLLSQSRMMIVSE